MTSAINRTVYFGNPVTVPCLIPVKHQSTPSCISVPFTVNGTCYKVTALSFGSAHGAVVVDDLDAVDVGTLGSCLGTHPLFPKGASIVFIQMLDGETLKARLWQKNEGEADFTAEAICVAGTAAMMLQKTPNSRAKVVAGDHSFQVEWNRGAGDGAGASTEILENR